MAKSPSGGTRAMIRGRVASDVYSVGKDGKGKKQQIVRSRPVNVSNPKTKGQVEQRIKMKAVAKMMSLLSPIVDHSWEGVDYGQLSTAEFMKRAMQAINTAIAGTEAQREQFLFPYPDTNFPLVGAYPVAAGSLSVPSSIFIKPGTQAFAGFNIMMQRTNSLDGSSALTIGDVRNALGVGNGDYLTYLFVDIVDNTPVLKLARVYFNKDNKADDTVIFDVQPGSDVAYRIANAFEVEGNMSVDFVFNQWQDGAGQLEVRCLNTVSWGQANCVAVIASRKVGSVWARSNSNLQFVRTSTTADGAIAEAYLELDGQYWPDIVDEWPIGAQRYLNGGDLA